eukprot:m.183489 g.183489  ORF g.183489 m.183489 type:complete len:54 (+) comp18480_c0_seq4:228-389(+)
MATMHSDAPHTERTPSMFNTLEKNTILNPDRDRLSDNDGVDFWYVDIELHIIL